MPWGTLFPYTGQGARDGSSYRRQPLAYLLPLAWPRRRLAAAFFLLIAGPILALNCDVVPVAGRTMCLLISVVMPKIELDGLPVIDAAESETITVAVSPDDLQAGDIKNPERHPVAIALRRRLGADDARVSEREVLIRRGKRWFRYEPPKPVQS